MNSYVQTVRKVPRAPAKQTLPCVAPVGLRRRDTGRNSLYRAHRPSSGGEMVMVWQKRGQGL